MMCLVFVESENAKICNVLQTYVKSQIVCILYVKSIFFCFHIVEQAYELYFNPIQVRFLLHIQHFPFIQDNE